MNTQMIAHKVSQTHEFLRVAHITPLRNILLGAGLCFAIQNEKYWHIPVTVIFPSVYAGYQTFKHTDSIVRCINDAIRTSNVRNMS